MNQPKAWLSIEDQIALLRRRGCTEDRSPMFSTLSVRLSRLLLQALSGSSDPQKTTLPNSPAPASADRDRKPRVCSNYPRWSATS